MSRKVSFSYPDIFRVVQYTLDHKRLIIQMIGVGAALLVYYLCGILSYQTQGSLKFLPWFFNLLGVIGSYLVLLIFAGPVTYLILQEIKTGRRGSIREAFQQGLRSGIRLALSPLGIISFLLAGGVILILLICLGMIPGLGPFLWSLLIVPQFALALFLVVGVLTLLAGTLLLPSIIVNEGVGPGKAFSLMRRRLKKHFLKFWGYIFTATFLNLIYFSLITLLMLTALYFLFFLSATILGDKPGLVVMSIPPTLASLAGFLETSFSLPSHLPPDGWLYPASGVAGGISLAFIYMVWLTYPFLYAFNSGVIIYLALEKKTVGPEEK